MTSLQTIYDRKISEGELKADPVQAQAVNVLNRLFEDVSYLSQKAEGGSFFDKIKNLAKSSKSMPPKGVYMHGGVGRGKSMVMDLFFDTLPTGIRKRRVHFHEFMIEVHDYIHSRRDYDITHHGEVRGGVDMALPLLAQRVAEQAQVLCFDEFHVVDVADAMILGRLFTALFDHGVIVVATSNWPPDRLYEGGLQRDRFEYFIALLKDRLEVVHLDSDTDYRADMFADVLLQNCAYFTPLGDETRRKMDDLFVFLTDKAPIEPNVLNVKGREIPVLVATHDAARFTFAELCEKPLGAEDYLKVAKTYSTIFLEDIPRLTYDRRNEAKRLMILIDALYETGNRLIVSAATPPDELYTGHDHAFEFDRTISRLLEMQVKAQN
jgi:cell division protein ZapE